MKRPCWPVGCWLVLALACLAGCDAPATTTRQNASPAPPAPPGGAAPAARATEPAAETKELRPATAGAGRQGQGYGGGVITEPIRQRFLIEQKLVFDVQIQQAMNLYKAQSPQGRGPATHEEFMQKIIKANQIKLPELPVGERYLYDPAAEQLMVERPANP